MSNVVSISRPVRIGEEMLERCEALALKRSVKEKRIIKVTDIVKEAIEKGLKEMEGK